MGVVSNAGPLIALAQIDQFDLLQLLYGEIVIPPAVHKEVVTFGQDRPGAREVIGSDWVRIETIRNPVAVELLREQLDQGESEAIVLAMENKADLLLIDEARGRRVSQAQALQHIGTIGILILARRQGLITSVTPCLDQLMETEFRMSAALYQMAQQLSDENG